MALMELGLPPAWRTLARRALPYLAVAAALFAIFYWTFGLAFWMAVAGLAVTAALIIAALKAPRDSTSETSWSSVTPLELPLARQWQGIVDALPDGALVLDPAGVVVALNSRVEDLVPSVRRGLAIAGLMRNPEFLAAVERVRIERRRDTVRYGDRVPIERRIEATIAPLPGAAGDTGAPFLIVSFRDLSEQERLEEMRADFIANASHELRTPLASLLGFIETLQGAARDDPAARERFLSTMASQAQRMTRLIDDLMSLSRIEMREHVRPRGMVDVNDVVRQVAEMFELSVKDAGGTLDVRLLDGEARVIGDHDELVQVVQNLVQNALKYGRDTGTVTVGVSRQTSPPRIAIEVADDGPGIAPDHLPRLTERFYRVESSVSRAKGGTGLGLAIVKHVVNRHQGELRIASERGKGSTFTVLLSVK